jgi:hypothetical protein
LIYEPLHHFRLLNADAKAWVFPICKGVNESLLHCILCQDPYEYNEMRDVFLGRPDIDMIDWSKFTSPNRAFCHLIKHFVSQLVRKKMISKLLLSTEFDDLLPHELRGIVSTYIYWDAFETLRFDVLYDGDN